MERQQSFQINYEYENTTDDIIELWFSEPRDNSTQKNISLQANMEPKEITKHEYVNNIWYFELQPKEKLEINIRYTGSKKEIGHLEQISEDERNFFLRSTELIPVNKQLQEEAQKIVGDVETDMAKAKKLYRYVVDNYKYTTRFNERGIFHFQNRKKGDCGEFGALYCSLCRALGIPARMLYGTWSLKKFSPHAWCEIYIDGQGWIPVDPSTGRLKFFYHPLLNLSVSIYYGVLSNKDNYFGEHEGKRFAFSVEPERLLTPAYQDSPDYSNSVIKQCFAKREMAWGYESLNGKAPFLQPIYVRIHDQISKTPYKLLFGDWKGKPLQPMENSTYKLKLISFNIAFILIYISIFNEFFIKNEWLLKWLPVTFSFLILLGSVLSIIRKEANMIIYVLAVVFVFSFLGYFERI